MTKTLKDILSKLNLSKEEAKTEQVVKLAEMKLVDETVIVADSFEQGQAVFIKTTEEDAEDVALPVGEYDLENGDVLKVETEGEISSVTAKEEEPKEEEAVVEEVEAEEVKEETLEDEPNNEEEVSNPDEKMAQLEARLVALEELLAPTEDLAEEEVKEEVEMSKEEEVVVEEVVTLSEEVTFSPEAKTPNNNNEGKFNFPKGMLGNKMGKSYTF